MFCDAEDLIFLALMVTVSSQSRIVENGFIHAIKSDGASFSSRGVLRGKGVGMSLPAAWRASRLAFITRR
jgi:hypothetical protein